MSILTDIIEWVEDKPLFWQETVDRIIRNKNLTEDDINDLVSICKFENGIIKLDYEGIKIDELKELVSSSDVEESIMLSKIKNNENINALKDNSELTFSSTGLTAIYGDNGSGKSSYASILKNTCNTRGELPTINFNLFDSDSGTKRQIAQVEYLKEDGTSGDITWKDHEIDSALLKAVDVFDSSSANHYVEGEDEIAFVPSGFSILEKLAKALNEVERIINSEKQMLTESSYDYSFLQDDVETEVSKFLRTLSAESKQEELDSLCSHTEKDDAEIKNISEAISKLRATDPAKEIKENNQRIKRFDTLKSKYKSLEVAFSNKAMNSTRDAVNNLVVASNASKMASEKAFSNLPMDGIGSDQWKKLWESARRFYDGIYGEDAFPNTSEGENCPLCLQELGDEARKRFINFEEFVKADLQEQLNKAVARLKELEEYFDNLNFDLSESEPTIDEINEIVEDFQKIEGAFLATLESKCDEVLGLIRDAKKVDSISHIEFQKSPITILETLIMGLETMNEELAKTSIEEQLDLLEKKHANLVAIKNLTNYKKQIEVEIERMKKVIAINKCASQCNTRNVTLLSNSLTETYVTKSLKDNFKEELRKLGFKNIEVVMGTKGVRGRQYHYLQLDTSYGQSVSLKEILSEGEHRCISLATFLSELSISEHKSAIIFDDPVSSLDHKWRSKIARRIVQEATTRQVIVFTHDITFLMMLQEEAVKLDCSIDVKSLTRKKTQTGIPASSPPWDALSVKGRLGELKNMHQILKKIEDEGTDEEYEDETKPFYGKLRETWERLIEELILNRTVQRFGREIQTKRLKIVIDLTDDDYQIVDDNMTKCSKFINGHDSAGALIEEMPDSEEIKTDINALESYISELRKRGRS
ncbi:AAA family ATPase [Aestuariivivens sediminicola]|uniref:AAA family ATPase n=1 Tax=Aestuariivivens sediminicola TaxID=2913560 RepID=UPI001F58259A|nr:AAA family ATPase [Aestuariivivens sediminicola]